MISSLPKAAGRLRDAIRNAMPGLIDRDQFAELLVLGAVAQEHALVIGLPRTTKSAASP